MLQVTADSIRMVRCRIQTSDVPHRPEIWLQEYNSIIRMQGYNPAHFKYHFQVTFAHTSVKTIYNSLFGSQLQTNRNKII